MRLKIVPIQLAMKRGATDAQRPCRRRDVSIGSQQGTLQKATLNAFELVPLPTPPAEQVRCWDRSQRAIRSNSEREARGPGRPNDEIVGINGQQTSGMGIARPRQDDPCLTKGGAEDFRFNVAGSFDDGKRNKIAKAVGAVGAARGNVEDAGKPRILVVDWCCSTA